MKTTLLITLAIIILLALGTCVKPPSGADMILFNGKIVTMDDNLPNGEALAIKDGLILAVGNYEGMKPYKDKHTMEIDLEGRLAIPGFIEGHAHFLGVGKAAMRLKLQKARNWVEIVSMVRRDITLKKPGKWILGRGWHQEKWGYSSGPILRRPASSPINQLHYSGQPGLSASCFGTRCLRQSKGDGPRRDYQRYSRSGRR
jgi:hypothetical protein